MYKTILIEYIIPGASTQAFITVKVKIKVYTDINAFLFRRLFIPWHGAATRAQPALLIQPWIVH